MPRRGACSEKLHVGGSPPIFTRVTGEVDGARHTVDVVGAVDGGRAAVPGPQAESKAIVEPAAVTGGVDGMASRCCSTRAVDPWRPALGMRRDAPGRYPQLRRKPPWRRAWSAAMSDDNARLTRVCDPARAARWPQSVSRVVAR